MKKILNILLGCSFALTLALSIWCMAVSGNEASLEQAVSVILIWGYALFGLAIAATLYCAVRGMVKNPAGMKAALVSIAIIIVIVGAALGIAFSHDGLTIPNSGGGVFDNKGELIITESSIIVTYVAFVVAFFAAIYAEVRNAFK